MIKACSNAGNLERAEYWNQYLEKNGIQQNDMGFGKLMEAGTTIWADLPDAGEFLSDNIQDIYARWMRSPTSTCGFEHVVVKAC